VTTELLTVPEAAARLKISRNGVYRLISLGQLRAVDVAVTGKSSKTRVRSDDLQAYIDANTREAG
jgi:excisionase family DNA binding protein